MRKLLFLALLIVGCKPSYVTEIPRDTNLHTGIHLKDPKRVVIFAEDATYYKYKEIKARISSLLPAASESCFCGITLQGGIIRIDGEKSWIIDTEKLPYIAALVLYNGKGKPEVVLDPKQYEKRLRQMWGSKSTR